MQFRSTKCYDGLDSGNPRLCVSRVVVTILETVLGLGLSSKLESDSDFKKITLAACRSHHSLVMSLMIMIAACSTVATASTQSVGRVGILRPVGIQEIAAQGFLWISMLHVRAVLGVVKRHA